MSKKSRNNTIQYDNNDYSNIVDLHGFTIAEALTQVQLSLSNAYESDFYYDYVTIITGKGQGAILANIEEYLRDANYDYDISADGASIKVFL
ncbi:Smr/MutS family protein [Mycoplasmopsis bovis]|uniref:Smr/MutS family protein n=1 Tax=Mycoplasmopsis bovis TaxID=28903 RepID=UPI000E104D9A|nr:Smr/MutS family protein [Mycoplasmopsis bovis]AXJ68462.1 DNA mismatch repair protein MutS [Mycoplasmopsis bovis]AXJ74132.1 DNA mismatch repair protein MutS [Mycoplasmopsis bovis]MBT1363574.1 DNA mismatch repair protein MutS [Mycoplasmopsis bovis]QQH26422.1 Smr/MutS family protein [Mycoplasmopsis bovis]QRF86183.1 Smr/MutS family protein [Mycoplasmopsis bovis]